jgi:hypothetical protein
MPTIYEILDRNDFQLTQAQERAHEVYRSIGLPGAPPPMSGEPVRGYRERLAGRLQHHCESWKKTELNRLPSNVLSIAEEAIYADAAKWGADKNRGNPDGTLRERQVTDQSGRTWTEFSGDPAVWMSDFMGPKKRLVGVKGASHIPGQLVRLPNGQIGSLS